MDPFADPTTKAGFGKAGDLAERAVLLVYLGDGIWELGDVAADDPESEIVWSNWRPNAKSRDQFALWDLRWVEPSETRTFAEAHFHGLDAKVVWGPRPN